MQKQNSVTYLVSQYQSQIRQKIAKTNHYLNNKKKELESNKDSDDDLRDSSRTLKKEFNQLKKGNNSVRFMPRIPLRTIKGIRNKVLSESKSNTIIRPIIPKKLINSERLNQKSIIKKPKNITKPIKPVIINEFWNVSKEKNKAKKKVSICVQSFGFKMKAEGEKKVEQANPNSISVVSETSYDNTEDTLMDMENEFPSKNTIVVLFDEISDILLKFPDEVDPLEFFTQYNTIIGNYLEYMNGNWDINERLQIIYLNMFHTDFVNGFTITVNNGTKDELSIDLPLSISYLLLNFPEVVQLCLFNNVLLDQLKKKKQIERKFNLNDFSQTLKNLCGIMVKSDPIEIRAKARKSIFGNSKLNNIFLDRESTVNFSPKTKNSFNHFKNEKQKMNSSMLVTQLKLNKETYQHKETRNEYHFGVLKEEPRNEYGLDFFKEEPVKEDIQTDEEPLDKSYESLVIDDSNSQNSISETEELKSEQSQSDNSCESDSESLLEEEYTSTNPFKNKYSVLTYKFRNYTITIEKPCITDIIGEVKHHLEAKDLFLMLRNEYEINTL